MAFSVWPALPHQHGSRVGDAAKTLFAFPQGFFRNPPVRGFSLSLQTSAPHGFAKADDQSIRDRVTGCGCQGRGIVREKSGTRGKKISHQAETEDGGKSS